jgi:hypothetical protein
VSISLSSMIHDYSYNHPAKFFIILDSRKVKGRRYGMYLYKPPAYQACSLFVKVVDYGKNG